MSKFKFILKCKNAKIKEFDESNVVEAMYNNLCVIPSLEDIKKYKLDNPEKYLKELKERISKISTVIPMFDIGSKNLYIIYPENIEIRVLFYNYRVPDRNIVQILESTLKKYSSSEPDDHALIYIKKLKKNINFLNCYDLDILRDTYHKLFYNFSEKTKEITNCIKPSYFPYIKNMRPYFTKSELRMMGKNLNLDLDLESDDIDSICDQVTANDIHSKIILYHHIYIKENYASSYIQLYTLLGSYYLNNYLRQKSDKDVFIEKLINNMWLIIKNAPEFDKDYYVYRFIEEDSYLSTLKVGDTYLEKSFISTTRNPFYNPKHNIFGLILIKIKLPKNIKGIGLCLETYSLFQQEEEILLLPGTLKLKGKDDDFTYFHTDIRAGKKITKKYEFEYVKPVDYNPSVNNYPRLNITIPSINFETTKIDGETYEAKIKFFYNNLVAKINTQRYFYSKIGDKKYLFQTFILGATEVYKKYFFIQKSSDIKKDQLFIIHQDENTGKIKFFLEIKDLLSLNYIFKYIGSNEYFDKNDLLRFVSFISISFGIDTVLVHDDYESYEKITEDNLKQLNVPIKKIINLDNPDIHIQNLYLGYFMYYPKEIISYLSSKGNYNHSTPYIPKYDNIPGIQQYIKYHMLDSLTTLKTSDLLQTIEGSILDTIYRKNKEKCQLVIDFYLLVHTKFFYAISNLNNIINNFFKYSKEYEFTSLKYNMKNPWKSNLFILDPQIYLYDNKIIPFFKRDKDVIDKYMDEILNEKKVVGFRRYREYNN